MIERRTAPVGFTDQEWEALEYLRRHPVPFVLAHEVRKMVVEEALRRGWEPRKGA